MATDIKINTVQASQSLKGLNQIIKASTSAARAQEAQFKSMGNNLGAAQAKYNGLGQSINALKDKLSLLETRQKSLDTSTADGVRQYNKYGTQIADTERRLSSMIAQQDRAKQSLNYYKSGLGELQSSYRSITQVSNSYVERLKAEGKTSEAAKAQLEGLRSQQNKLSEIYKIQNNELNRLAESAGKSSEAYKRQEVRVNQTATSLAKTKTEMSQVSSEMKKANPSVFDRLKAKITGVNGEAKKTHSLFKTIFSASFVSNLASNAFSSATSGLKSIISSGMQLDGVIGKIRAQWAGLGKSSNDTQILIDQMGYLKSNTAMTGDEVQQLQLNMNRLTNGNTEHTVELSKGIATIGDATKMTSGEMVGLSSAMARALSGSKVSAMQWQRMTKQAPGLGAALSKAAGMSEAAFGKMVNSGKMSTKQFEQLVEKAGQDGGKAFEKFRKTQGGAAKSMQDSWNSLKAKMAQPLFDVKTSGMQQLAELMQSKPVMDGAELLGKGLQQIAKWAMKGLGWLANHKQDIIGIGSDFISIAKDLAVDTWKTMAGIISDIASALGLTSKNAKDSQDPLKQVKGALDGLAKNKSAIKAISNAIVAIAVIKTLSPVTTGLMGIANAASKGYKYVKALHAGFKGLDSIKELKGPEKALAKLGSTAQTVFSKIKGFASKITSRDFAGGAFQTMRSAGGFKGLTTAGKVTTGLAGAGVALDAGSSIISAINDKKGSTKQFQDAGKGIGTAIGGGIGLAFGGPIGAAIGSQIGKLAGQWGGKATKSFLKGWQSKKPPKNFWSIENLGWSTKDALGKAGKGIDSWWKSVQKSNKKAQKEQEKQAKAEERQRQKNQKAWNKYWSNLGKGWNSYWKKVGKNSDQGVKKLQKSVSSYIKKAKKSWSSHWKDSVKTVSKWSTDTKKNYEKGIKYLNKSFNSYTRGAKKSWSSHWKSLKKNVEDFWNDSQKKTKKGSKNLLSNIKDYAKKSGKRWGDHFNDVAKGFDSFSKELQDNHGNLMKTLKQSAKDNLAKIAKNWSDKWDSIKKNTGTAWDKIKSGSQSSLTKLRSSINSGMTKIRSTWGSIWDAISKKTSSIWSGIKNTVNSGVNGVKRMINGMIDGLDSVWKFFTGHKTSIRHLATGGFISSEHLAVINDEPTNNYQELVYRRRTGKYQMYEGRNRLIPVEPGDEIINGATTARLKKIGAIPHFAGGGIVGSLVNSAQNVAKDIGGIAKNSLDFLVDKMDKIEDWLKDPIGNIKKTIEKWTSGLSAGPVFTEVGRGAINKLIDPIAEWFKARLKKLDDDIGELGNPGGAGVARWRPFVIKALKMNGFEATGSQVAAWMRVIARESGGNPKAINLWDSNAKAGHPSMGLVQTIGPTFNAYKFPGHNNPMNGFDDLLAGINYMKHIYGTGPGAFATVSGPHGYANGGIARMSQFASLAEDNIPETIIPWDVTKRGRAYQLMDQTLKAFGATDNPKRGQDDSDKTNRAILSVLEQILLMISGFNDQDIINNIDVTLGSEVLEKLTQKVKRTFRDDQIKGRLNISGIR